MALPINPPFPPMEALLVDALPEGQAWQYEPKWDGFRCVAFGDGGEVYLQSKGLRPLARYFPDVAEELGRLGAGRFVLDGELVVAVDGQPSFEELQLRLHPAASRVARLAAAHPAEFIVFDLLADERGRSLVQRPLSQRRQQLEAFARRFFGGIDRIRLSPATSDLRQARRWFAMSGGGLDGIVAKRLDLPYMPGERAMQKFKHIRTADCVVGGFRYAARGRVAGSLLLGLYDEAGLLNHVGFTANISHEAMAAVTPQLEAMSRLAGDSGGFTGTAPGGPSRWSTERTGEWEPLPPELVVEVTYDHVSGGRFRHGTGFVRWRPDKLPRQCTMDQIAAAKGSSLKLLKVA